MLFRDSTPAQSNRGMTEHPPKRLIGAGWVRDRIGGIGKGRSSRGENRIVSPYGHLKILIGNFQLERKRLTQNTSFVAKFLALLRRPERSRVHGSGRGQSQRDQTFFHATAAHCTPFPSPYTNETLPRLPRAYEAGGRSWQNFSRTQSR